MNRADDLIPRAAAIEAFDDERVERNYGDVSPESVIRVIESIPAVDVALVIHGCWIDVNPDVLLDPRMQCSVCGSIEHPLARWKYCPNCGAKMEAKNE